MNTQNTYFSASVVGSILKNRNPSETKPTTHVNLSEQIGFENIVKSFSKVFPDARFLNNVILPMETDNQVKTAEYDVIVVCSAGIFIFEIKGYSQCKIWYDKGENGVRHWKTNNGTNTLEINDPICQGMLKLKYIRDSIKCLTRYYVYFPLEGIELEPTLPATVITNDELNYVPRVLRSDAKAKCATISKEEVDVIADTITEISSNYTFDEHVANCRSFHEKKVAQ